MLDFCVYIIHRQKHKKPLHIIKPGYFLLLSHFPTAKVFDVAFPIHSHTHDQTEQAFQRKECLKQKKKIARKYLCDLLN